MDCNSKPRRSLAPLRIAPLRIAPLRIATLNVRGLSSKVKQECLKRGLNSYRVDICCIQETKLVKDLDTEADGYRLISFPPVCRHYGLGFAISSRFTGNINRLWQVSDRVAVVTFSGILKTGHGGRLDGNRRNAGRADIGIINVYAPTAARCAQSADELDLFYSALQKAYDEIRNCTLFYVIGDFNAKVGTRRAGESSLGSHGRGRRNINGQTRVDFCESNKLYFTNTTFQHAARHKTTWIGYRRDMGSGKTVPIYNQIDYVVCREGQRRLLRDSRSYGGICISTDHRLVVADIQLDRLYGTMAKHDVARTVSSTKKQFNVPKLVQSTGAQQKYRKEVERMLPLPSADESSQEYLSKAMSAIKQAAAAAVGYANKPRNRRCTLDPEIDALSKTQKDLRLRIMNTVGNDKAAQLKQERNRISHEIRRRCRENAERRLDAMAEEVERQKDGAQMYRAVALLTRKKAPRPVVEDVDGHIVGNAAESVDIIKGHFCKQFSVPGGGVLEPFVGEPRPLQRPITTEELQQSITRLNNNRSSGPDGEAAELLKYAGPMLIGNLTDCLNRMFQQCIIALLIWDQESSSLSKSQIRSEVHQPI